MQLKIRYWLFSFLTLFTVINSAVAEPRIHHAAQVTADKPVSVHTVIQGTNTDPASLADYQYCFTDIFISNPQVSQTAATAAGKRVQSGKDLLLLHADDFSKTVKMSSCYQVKFTDNLTHVFLFLFPYHFFW